MIPDPVALEQQALELWEQAQDARAQLAKSQHERLRDFGLLLGVQQSLPDDLKVDGGTDYYANSVLRGIELDKIALLRAAGHILPDLYGKLATVPEPVTLNGTKRHGFPQVPQEALPHGMKQCVVCGQIWSLLNFYPQADHPMGVENRCKVCAFEAGSRNRARKNGTLYQCRSEYAAVKAVYPDEGPEERRAMGLVIHPPKESRAPVKTGPRGKMKPVPNPGPRVSRGGRDLSPTPSGDGVAQYEWEAGAESGALTTPNQAPAEKSSG